MFSPSFMYSLTKLKKLLAGPDAPGHLRRTSQSGLGPLYISFTYILCTYIHVVTLPVLAHLLKPCRNAYMTKMSWMSKKRNRQSYAHCCPLFLGNALWNDTLEKSESDKLLIRSGRVSLLSVPRTIHTVYYLLPIMQLYVHNVECVCAVCVKVSI
ncbi:hypothetical protein F4805DRAFT_162018 [Annulohypoxylon moriforme]|nr:hypothetical protein F4805DRAFT_162018 [Annulohypoxylon moriforme]